MSAGAKRKLLRNPFFWGAVAGVVLIPLIRPLTRHVPDPPPVLGALPAFELVSQDGRPFGSSQLRGRVYVANFFFTSCRTICPGLTKAMGSLQNRFKQHDIAIHLVSFSVDPETDTPPLLRAYATKHGADLDRWTFVTGSMQAMRAVVVDGFKTHMGAKIKVSNDLVDISHASLFALVDDRGRVRGYYRADKMGLDEVFHRAQHVLKESVERRGK